MQKIPIRMWIVSQGHKKVPCLHVKVLFYFLGALYVVTSRKSMGKKPWENIYICKYLQMTVLVTKYFYTTKYTKPYQI